MYVAVKAVKTWDVTALQKQVVDNKDSASSEPKDASNQALMWFPGILQSLK